MPNNIRLAATLKDSASKGLANLRSSADKLSDSAGRKLHGALRTAGGAIKTVGKIALVAAGAGLLALVGVLGMSIEKASNLNEQMSKVRVVFGKAAKPLIEWSKTTAKAMGISQTSTLEALGTFGNLFRALKIGVGPAAKMSKSLVQLAGDLASFNDIDPSEALIALRAALVGETEPIRRLGVNMNELTLRQEAYRLGLVKTTKEALPANIKAQAAYSLIMQQTSLAQGDAAKTGGQLAGQQRKLAAIIEDAMARIGSAVLPIAVTVMPGLIDVIERVAGFITDKLIPAVQTWVHENEPLIRSALKLGGEVLGGLAAVIGTVITKVVEVAGSIGTWLEKNRPLVTQIRDALVTAVKALFGAISTVVTWIGNLVTKISENKAAMNFLRSFAQSVGDLFTLAWKAMQKFAEAVSNIGKRINANKDAMTFLRIVLSSIVGFINDIISKAKFALTAVLALVKALNKLAGGYGGDIPGYNPPHPGVIPHAGGGQTMPGKTYLVGEKGPELWSPKTAGMVTPNHALGGGTTVNVAFNSAFPMSPSQGQQVVRAAIPELVRELRRQGV